jgi:hypothetical protein
MIRIDEAQLLEQLPNNSWGDDVVDLYLDYLAKLQLDTRLMYWPDTVSLEARECAQAVKYVDSYQWISLSFADRQVVEDQSIQGRLLDDVVRRMSERRSELGAIFDMLCEAVGYSVVPIFFYSQPELSTAIKFCIDRSGCDSVFQMIFEAYLSSRE